MKRYFLDTSALVKHYHQEVGTDTVDEIFNSKERLLLISDISIIEFHSALGLKVRTAEITKDTFKHAIGLFAQDITNTKYQIETFGNTQKKEAADLLIRYAPEHHIRTLDSMQLSVMKSASIVDQIESVLCADKRFCEIIHLEGFKVINPEEPWLSTEEISNVKA